MFASRNYIMPCMAALLLHALLAVVFGGGWQLKPESRIVQPVKVVQATLVTIKKEPAKKQSVAAKPKPKQKPKPAPSKKVEKKPVKETPVKEKPKPDLDKLKQQQLKEQAEKRLADEKLLATMAADEEAEMQASEDADLLAQYTAMIAQQMHQTWKLPPSARRDMLALLKIRMLPTGDIISVTVLQSSGNEAFDQSAMLAVEKAGRFVFMTNLPSRLFETHFREFIFQFSPKDLRL